MIMSLTCQSTTNRIMTWFSICFFFAVFAIAKIEVIKGMTLAEDTPSTNPPPKVGDKCNAGSWNYIVCENNKLIFCTPTNQVESAPCIVNGRQGFCNCEKTGCVAEKPTCSDDSLAEDCLTPNAKLPDNLDCQKFSFCNEENKKVVFKCPDGLVYDPNTEKCTSLGLTRCARVICPRQNNTLALVPFPQARNYYLLCYQGIGDVRKCPDKFYTVQNNSCHFDCNMKNESGVFRDTNLQRCNEGVYYSCKKSGKNYITNQKKCTAGKYYDENLGVCTSTNTCQ